MAQSTHRRAMIAKIKIAQKQLGMDDDVYRELLHRMAGKRSCTELTATELARVLREMERLGFAPSRPAPERMPLRQARHTPMMQKIGVLLAQTGKTWAYADGMARNMFGVPHVNQLDSNQMHRLTAALQIYANRQQNPKK